MLTRRHFVKASFIPLLLPKLSLANAAKAPANYCAFNGSSRACDDVQDFANACKHEPVSAAPQDVWDVQHLAASPGLDRIMGLTPDSDYFLMEQLLAQHGFRQAYFGSHRYGEGIISHDVRAASDVVMSLKRLLDSTAAGWASCVGGVLPLVTQTSNRKVQRSFTCKAHQPLNSPGYLVSWVFQRTPS